MIKGVIFDLWNTLIRPTDRNHAIRQIRLIHNLGKSDYKTVKKALMTVPLNNVYEVAEFLKKKFRLNHMSEPDLQNLERIINEDNHKVNLADDALKTLEYLKKNNIKTALISNAATFHKHPFYRFGLDKYFDYICFSCDVGYWKPEKEIYLMTLEKLGLKPEETIMIGDNKLKDCEMPRLIGMHGVHLDIENKSDAVEKTDSLYSIISLIKERPYIREVELYKA